MTTIRTGDTTRTTINLSESELRERVDELEAYPRLSRKQETELVEYKTALSLILEGEEAERRQAERSERLATLRRQFESGAATVERGSDALDEDDMSGRGADARPDGRDSARRRLDELRSLPDEGRERLTRAFERVEAAPDGGAELDALSRWLLVTSDPAYARAVAHLFRDPTNGHREFSQDELRAYRSAQALQRTMLVGTGSAGGFLLPTHLDPTIMLTNASVVDPIRALARNETIATNEWNGITSAGVTASWDAEDAEVSDDSPTLADAAVPTHKGAAFIEASLEHAMDTNIGEQVSGLFIDAKMRLEGTAFLTGSGTGQPQGIINGLAAGQKVATALADTVAAGDVTGLQAALPARWQSDAVFLANLATTNRLGAIETTAGSLRFPEVADDRLLRRRLAEHSGMKTPGTTPAAGNDDVLLYGSLGRGYLVVDRIGATVEFIPHLLGANGRPTGTRGWYMYWRTGGEVLIQDAFRLLQA